MPYSYIQYPASAGVGPLTLGFPYQLRGDIRVYRDLDLISGAYSAVLQEGTGYTWPSATQIQLVSPLPAGSTLTIRRETPTAGRRVDWADGSNLTGEALDTADLQKFYALQEMADANALIVSTAAQAQAAAAQAATDAGEALAGAILAQAIADRSPALFATIAASGSALDFTGIPDWAKRVTLLFSGLSTNGTSDFRVILGGSALVTSGYQCLATRVSTSNTPVTTTTAFLLTSNNSSPSDAYSGQASLTLAGPNTWVLSGSIAAPIMFSLNVSAGSIALPSALQRVRVTTVNGTDLFDQGSVSLLVE